MSHGCNQRKADQLRDTAYTPIVNEVPTNPHTWAKCLNYKKDLFVSVTGLLTPCPWFNSNYQNNEFVKNNIQRLSIKHRSFFDILNDSQLWQEFIELLDTTPPEICQIKCKNSE